MDLCVYIESILSLLVRSKDGGNWYQNTTEWSVVGIDNRRQIVNYTGLFPTLAL